MKTKIIITEDKLIFLRLIDGMRDTSHKHKILKILQISNINLGERTEFLQLELIKEFSQQNDGSDGLVFV